MGRVVGVRPFSKPEYPKKDKQVNCRHFPGESLIIEIEPQRVNTGDKDVDSSVKLEAIDEEGVLEVPLNTEGALFGVLCLRNITEVTEQPISKPTGTLRGKGGHLTRRYLSVVLKIIMKPKISFLRGLQYPEAASLSHQPLQVVSLPSKEDIRSPR